MRNALLGALAAVVCVAVAVGNGTHGRETEQFVREVLRDAVRCHFEEADRPQLIRIHYVRDEVIAA